LAHKTVNLFALQVFKIKEMVSQDLAFPFLHLNQLEFYGFSKSGVMCMHCICFQEILKVFSFIYSKVESYCIHEMGMYVSPNDPVCERKESTSHLW